MVHVVGSEKKMSCVESRHQKCRGKRGKRGHRGRTGPGGARGANAVLGAFFMSTIGLSSFVASGPVNIIPPGTKLLPLLVPRWTIPGQGFHITILGIIDSVNTLEPEFDVQLTSSPVIPFTFGRFPPGTYKFEATIFLGFNGGNELTAAISLDFDVLNVGSSFNIPFDPTVDNFLTIQLQDLSAPWNRLQIFFLVIENL